MKLPRNLSGAELIRGLERFGYRETRQKGSHVRLTTTRNGEHHITVPMHNPLKVGTLASILQDVAAHVGLDRNALVNEMFQ